MVGSASGLLGSTGIAQGSEDCGTEVQSARPTRTVSPNGLMHSYNSGRPVIDNYNRAAFASVIDPDLPYPQAFDRGGPAHPQPPLRSNLSSDSNRVTSLNE